MPTCAIVSFRLGGTDGVSIVAASWGEIFTNLGFDVVTVAGDGPVDRPVKGLELLPSEPPDMTALVEALADADLVVVENLCSIPLNLAASRAVAEVLQGRPAIMHHHDPPWQRERFSHVTELPFLDPAWVHVTINDLTREQFEDRGIAAHAIYNAFDTTKRVGDRPMMRNRLGVADDELLIAHPVRAIARKNIPVALRLVEQLQGTYWLLGQAEDGYGPELDWLLASANCKVIQRRSTLDVADIYAAADAVVFPSLWEGFGNPPVEASIHRRPVIVGDYPVATELRGLGFDWFFPHEVEAFRADIASPNLDRLDRNQALVAAHFSYATIGRQLGELLDAKGWHP